MLRRGEETDKQLQGQRGAEDHRTLPDGCEDICLEVAPGTTIPRSLVVSLDSLVCDSQSGIRSGLFFLI